MHGVYQAAHRDGVQYMVPAGAPPCAELESSLLVAALSGQYVLPNEAVGRWKGCNRLPAPPCHPMHFRTVSCFGVGVIYRRRCQLPALSEISTACASLGRDFDCAPCLWWCSGVSRSDHCQPRPLVAAVLSSVNVLSRVVSPIAPFQCAEWRILMA